MKRKFDKSNVYTSQSKGLFRKENWLPNHLAEHSDQREELFIVVEDIISSRVCQEKIDCLI